MKTDSPKRIIWYATPPALKPRFRRPAANHLIRSRTWEDVSAAARRCRDHTDFPSDFSPLPAPEEESEETGQATILVPIDFSADSADAIHFGVSTAQHTRARLILCHSMFVPVIRFGPASPLWVLEGLRDEALEKMRPFAELAEDTGLDTTCVIEEGTPAGVVLKVARCYAADLIILTHRKHSTWARMLFGPTTAEQIADEADCHVIIVRPAAD